MKNTSALVAVLAIASICGSGTPVFAQPKKLPEAEDPYAEAAKPVLAAPPPVTPKAPKGAKAPKTPKGAKAPKGAPADPYATTPQDPYAADPLAHADPKKDPKKTGKGAPVPQASSDPMVNPNAKAPADPYAEPVPPAIPARVGLDDLAGIQGLLVVQHLDGWLLCERDGSNPIAAQLVAPAGHPTRPWFYLVPAKGAPVALVHSSEVRNFDKVPGTKLTYSGVADLQGSLKILLKGKKTVALEYSPKAAVPSISRVDAGTVELVRGAGVQIKSSETLVQFTKAVWGDAGRTSHFIAVHHLVEMRKDALAFIAQRIAANQPVTDYDVQQRIVKSMTVRGLVGQPPVVASGVNTADPYYAPSQATATPIKRGDLIVLSLAARADKPNAIWAAQTWVAVADTAVLPLYANSFALVKSGRDEALKLITDRMHKHRPVMGADVDDAVRDLFKKAGAGTHVMHRTGHSIDTDFQGGGADLDNFEVKDKRILTAGTGVTIGPGLYLDKQYGVRTEVTVFLSPAGPEVTTPSQESVEAILAR